MPFADKMQGVQVKLCYTLTMRPIPERIRDALCGSAIRIDYLLPFLQRLSQLAIIIFNVSKPS